MSRIVEVSQRAFGEAMRSHKNRRELHISFPWIHHLLCTKALKVNEEDIHKSLNKCEVPTIAETIIYHKINNTVINNSTEEGKKEVM